MTSQTPLPTYKRQEIRINSSDVIGGILENVFENLTGVPQSFESREAIQTQVPETFRKAFSQGAIEDFSHPRTKSVERSDQELIIEQQAAVIEATNIMRQARAEFIDDEKIRNEIAGISVEDKNRRLHVSADLREELTDDAYHMAELHRQIKAELRESEQQEKVIEIPSPAKQEASALETQFEGGAGKVGTGSANLKLGIG